MSDNYTKIFQENLNQLYSNPSKDLAKNLPGEQEGDSFSFVAFGERCIIQPNKISLNEKEPYSVLGILISLYALNANSDRCVLSPLKSFKEFSGSMPYVGAFSTHTEQLLVPYVDKIKEASQSIFKTLKGEKSPSEARGDFSFIVYPLPKIALCYIFYEADDDFPASVTCLYSNNADRFMPVDGLADVGEYTSKKILTLIDY